MNSWLPTSEDTDAFWCINRYFNQMHGPKTELESLLEDPIEIRVGDYMQLGSAVLDIGYKLLINNISNSLYEGNYP